MSGMEVEELRPVAPPFHGVVVGEVLSVERHPDADRLNVCRVDVGDGEPLTVVCGAPNVAAGMKAPCARVGAELPPSAEGGEPFVIRLGLLRGVESQGMLCSARELKLSDDHGGLLALPADAVVGQRHPRAAAARRHPLHAQAHAQPGARAERLRHRPRSGGAHRRAAEDPCHPADGGARRRRCPAAGTRRGGRPVRTLQRPHRARRESARRHAGLDGRSPRALRPAIGHRAGRHLELRDVRDRPADAHLRPRQDSRRPRRALGATKARRSNCSTAQR